MVTPELFAPNDLRPFAGCCIEHTQGCCGNVPALPAAPIQRQPGRLEQGASGDRQRRAAASDTASVDPRPRHSGGAATVELPQGELPLAS